MDIALTINIQKGLIYVVQRTVPKQQRKIRNQTIELTLI
ncbi:MAG: hypothetical protein ACI89T_001582 [Cognaticolwellia sp.]|jgi:hypothetical protein